MTWARLHMRRYRELCAKACIAAGYQGYDHMMWLWNDNTMMEFPA